MNTQTFKTAYEGSTATLTVKQDHDGSRPYLRLEMDGKLVSGIVLDNTDAPAIALAFLEAAGLVRDSCSGDDAEVALEWLHSAVARREREAKEAADLAELEAEAVSLYLAFYPDSTVTRIIEFSPVMRGRWTNTARHARELHNKAVS